MNYYIPVMADPVDYEGSYRAEFGTVEANEHVVLGRPPRRHHSSRFFASIIAGIGTSRTTTRLLYLSTLVLAPRTAPHALWLWILYQY